MRVYSKEWKDNQNKITFAEEGEGSKEYFETY
jgi:hypothetical protein